MNPKPQKPSRKKRYFFIGVAASVLLLGTWASGYSAATPHTDVVAPIVPVVQQVIPTQTVSPAPASKPASKPAPPAPDVGLSNDNYYTNTAGNEVHSPAYSNSDTIPVGASARCGDGTYSFSQSRRGTCSHHGGVATWY